MSNLPATTAANRIARQQETPSGRQFLTFTLGGEMFAIPLEHIREIIEFGGLTEIPMMPGFLRGVINLRGAVVPVIDLSARFGRAPSEIARRTCIVILEVMQQDQLTPLGVIVDAVSEVLSVEHTQIEPRPSFGAKIRAEFIEGMINHRDKFVVALDVQHVLSVDEMASLIGFGAAEVPG